MNRFKKYDLMEIKNNYWGDFNLKNTEDKLIFSLQKFFNILNEETKINENKSI